MVNMSITVQIEVDDTKFACSEETARKILLELQRLFGAPVTIVYPPGTKFPDVTEPYKVTC